MGITQTSAKCFRPILRFGSLFFGPSAVALSVVPGFFNELLGLQSTVALKWSMRMTGVPLVALAGKKFAHASRVSDDSVRFAEFVMLVSAFALGVVTQMIAASLTWFTVTDAIVGFAFSGAYVLSVVRPRQHFLIPLPHLSQIANRFNPANCCAMRSLPLNVSR